MLMAYQYNGEITERTPLGEATGAGGYPAGVYPCEDGFFQITGAASTSSECEHDGYPEELSGDEC